MAFHYLTSCHAVGDGD